MTRPGDLILLYIGEFGPQGCSLKKKKNGGNFLDFDSKALGDYPVMNRRVWSLGVFVKTFF